MKLLIKNATIYSSKGPVKKDVLSEDGRIAEVSDSISAEADQVIDGSDKYLFPGFIDTQVHFREPGLTHKEDLLTGSQAAALGGVTTFFEMPNTNPSTTTVEAVQQKIESAASKCPTNFAFYIGATGENLEELQKSQGLEGICGIKIFLGSSTGDLLLYESDKLLDIFKNTECIIACHSENEIMLRERIDIKKNAKSAHEHPVWRDEQTAFTSTQRLIGLAKEAGRKVHVLHVTTQEEIEFLKENKEHCTVEVTPQHLTLIAPDCYDRLGSYAQMNPPIREGRHREALWQGVLNGTVDLIGSDHAPHTREEKDQGYPMSPSGMPGVQTIVPLMLDYALSGKISLEDLTKFLCENPAQMYGMSKGYIEVGRDADFTLVDPKASFEIKDEDQASRVGWTPFNGQKVKGLICSTIVNGVVVAENGKLTGERGGKPVTFKK